MGTSLGPDAADCVVDLFLEAGDQFAVGVYERSLGFDLRDDGLPSAIEHANRRLPSLALHLRWAVLPKSFCTIMAVTSLGSGMGGDLLCTSTAYASA